MKAWSFGCVYHTKIRDPWNISVKNAKWQHETIFIDKSSIRLQLSRTYVFIIIIQFFKQPTNQPPTNQQPKLPNIITFGETQRNNRPALPVSPIRPLSSPFRHQGAEGAKLLVSRRSAAPLDRRLPRLGVPWTSMGWNSHWRHPFGRHGKYIYRNMGFDH